jgi:hypothetical protein
MEKSPDYVTSCVSVLFWGQLVGEGSPLINPFWDIILWEVFDGVSGFRA